MVSPGGFPGVLRDHLHRQRAPLVGAVHKAEKWYGVSPSKRSTLTDD